MGEPTILMTALDVGNQYSDAVKFFILPTHSVIRVDVRHGDLRFLYCSAWNKRQTHLATRRLHVITLHNSGCQRCQPCHWHLFLTFDLAVSPQLATHRSTFFLKFSIPRMRSKICCQSYSSQFLTDTESIAPVPAPSPITPKINL